MDIAKSETFKYFTILNKASLFLIKIHTQLLYTTVSIDIQLLEKDTISQKIFVLFLLTLTQILISCFKTNSNSYSKTNLKPNPKPNLSP